MYLTLFLKSFPTFLEIVFVFLDLLEYLTLFCKFPWHPLSYQLPNSVSLPQIMIYRNRNKRIKNLMQKLIISQPYSNTILFIHVIWFWITFSFIILVSRLIRVILAWKKIMIFLKTWNLIIIWRIRSVCCPSFSQKLPS